MEEIRWIRPIGADAANIARQVYQDLGLALLEHPPHRVGVGQVVILAAQTDHLVRTIPLQQDLHRVPA